MENDKEQDIKSSKHRPSLVTASFLSVEQKTSLEINDSVAASSHEISLEAGTSSQRANSQEDNSQELYSQDAKDQDAISQSSIHSESAYMIKEINEVKENPRNTMTEIASLVVEAKKDDRSSRKIKEFDIEKLKPFFIQFEEPVQEITELEICNNILLFLMVIAGLSLVFLFGIGVSLSGILS